MNNRNELFIVLASAAVLFVMLFSVVGMGAGCSGNEKAKQVYCTSNLQQLGLAAFQYAMINDDWFPTSGRTSKPIWMNGSSGKSLNLLFKPQGYSSALQPDPMVYLCPGKKGISPAKPNDSLQGHVSYNWCDGLQGGDSYLSPIACDGVDNHMNSGRFLRGDGSVGTVVGSRSVKWTNNGAFKDFCYGGNPPTYSF